MTGESEHVDVFTGVRWSAVATYCCQAAQLVTSIVLARLLEPEYFGLLAMAQVFVGLASVLSTMGFSQAIIQRQKVTEELLSSLFLVGVAIGSFLSALLACVSPLIAWLYGNEAVGPLVAVLGLSFAFQALGLVPNALLVRRLQFNRIAVIDIVVTLLSSAASVTLAWRGWGVWALVWPSLAASIARVPILYGTTRWRPTLTFRRAEVRGVLGFGANLTGFNILNYFARNADNFIIGAFLGATALGYYSFAYGLMLRPRDVVTSVVSRVLFPAFARMQSDDERLGAAYLRACGGIALLTFPMMIGLVAVARPFVQVVVGEQWLPAVPLIYVLAPIGMLQSIWSTVGELYLAKGRADWMFRWGIVSSTLIVGSFLAGLPFGVVGVAVSYAAMVVLLSIPGFLLPFKLVPGLSLRALGRSLMPALVSALAMGVVVVPMRIAIESAGGGPEMTLLTSVGIGGLVYTVVIAFLRPPSITDLGRLVPVRTRRLVHRCRPMTEE